MSSPSQSASARRAVVRLGIVVSSAFLAACASSEAAEPPKSADARPRVTVTTPLRGPTVVHVLGAGPLAAKRETDLAFKLGGVVASVAVEEGASVKRGQVLATLAAADVDAQAAAAAGLAKAERDFARIDVLYKKDTVPRATWDDAASARDVARAQLRAVRDAQGRSVLVAPDDGFVTKRYVERGAVIAAGFPAFHLQGAEKGFVVRMAIADRDALAAVPGSPASVTFPALPGKRFVAVVGEKPRASAPGTGAFELEVLLAPENRELPALSGLSAEVDVSVPIQAAASVPMGALVGENRDHATIFLVDAKNTVHRTPVVIARVVDGVALLAERLPDGDVVLAGAEGLVDGEEVVIRREGNANSHGDSQ